MSPTYKIIVPVWGQRFVARFLRYGLPTQLAPGNLPALPAERCAYHVFTTSADAAEMRRAPTFERLCRLVPTFFENIDGVYRGHAYAAMTECHNRGLALGRGANCVFVFLSPDSLWSDGSFRAMHALIAAGKRAIVMAGPRVTAEEVLPQVGERFASHDASIRLTGRELADACVRFIHPSARAYLWEQGSSRGAGHYCWKVGNHGILIRATHLHPVAVRPTKPQTRLLANLDGDFVSRCCPDVSQIHVVTDSDEMCALEFSDADYLEGYYRDTPLSRDEHLAFLERNTDDHHRDYLRCRIRIHAAEIGSEWHAAETESDAVVEQLLRDFARTTAARLAAPTSSSGEPSRTRLPLGRLARAFLDRPFKRTRLGPLDSAAMRPEGKFGFVVDLAALGVFSPSDKEFHDSAGARVVSGLVLLEDGKPLGPPHQMHEVIRNKGAGRFSHWGTGLHFSTSDNSDPRTNGRAYTMIVPHTLAGFLRRGWWRVTKRRAS
jgi:hypothetical protein